jgi:integrase
MLTRPWHIQVTSPLHRSKKTWFPPELRQRFLEDLQLQGMSARTQQAYTRVVRLLSQHYQKSPDQITEEELRQYFLHVKNVKHWSRATMTQSICGIKRFFEHTLQRDWTTLQIVRPAKEKRLPVILTREEVRLILNAIRLLRYRACLTTIYACGLRLKEGTHLQVADIDSPRMLVHVHLPHDLNPLARAHQKLVYDLLFQASAATLQTLARDPKFIGGQLGMVGVLHTWARDLSYHLHVHYLIPSGGLDPTTGQWHPTRSKFLLPIKALGTIFRAKFRDALVKTGLFPQVNPTMWQKPWVVHSQPVGDGKTALQYLTPYIYRVAISNRRLVSMQDGKVTFSDKPRKKPWKTMTLDVMSFMQRFLQHVLPKGFQKVRSFGFLHPSANKRFNAIKEQLAEKISETIDKTEQNSTESQETSSKRHTPDAPGICPHCGAALRYIGRLPRCPTIETPEQQRGPP